MALIHQPQTSPISLAKVTSQPIYARYGQYDQIICIYRSRLTEVSIHKHLSLTQDLTSQAQQAFFHTGLFSISSCTPKMKLTLVTLAAATAAGTAYAQSSAYGQCGGIGWSGSTSCVSGYTCQRQSDYYSQCLPGTATTTRATTTTSRTGGSTPTSGGGSGSGRVQYAGVNVSTTLIAFPRTQLTMPSSTDRRSRFRLYD